MPQWSELCAIAQDVCQLGRETAGRQAGLGRRGAAMMQSCHVGQKLLPSLNLEVEAWAVDS
jgi:hypothetical protein